MNHQEPKSPPAPGGLLETASGCPRDFLGNRFVYVVISPRARGLSVGVNMNPDKKCNFDCVYCEVNRDVPARESVLEVEVMAAELQQTLAYVHSGRIRERPAYCALPEELLRMRHVTLSGDGEPTLCPNFAEAVQAVIHVRALGGFPFFKMVLITNGTGLDQPQVQHGLEHFTKTDEIWIKLEAGTEAYMERVNRPQAGTGSIRKVLDNILLIARKRPVVIQSLFPQLQRQGPSPEEVEQFAERLRELKEQGADIALVQIYSATRPILNSSCGHLSLKSLSQIAATVRQRTGLRVEVF